MRIFGKFGKIVVFLFLFSFLATGAGASEKIRVGVLAFESKAPSVSQQQAEMITDVFTRELANSSRIEIYERLQMEAIGREVKLGMSGLVDMGTAVEVGKIAGLQYILLGAVTELSQKASGGAFAGIGGISHEARATIDMRVVEVETSRIVYAVNAQGTSKNSGSAVSFGGFTFAEAEFDGIEARAIADAVSVLVHKLRSEVADENSHVISVSDGSYTIDVRAQPGALYLVYADGKSILDMNGRVIDREKVPFAVIKVTDAGAGHSTATLAEGCSGSLIRRGDKIEPISAARAKELVTGKKFAKDRPSASNSTFEQVFGGATATESPATPTSTGTGASTQQAAPKKIEGFDPNTSTDAKVIETYPINSTEVNNLGILQRSTYSMYKNRKYKDAYEGFKRGVDSYNGHYLAAYWAGMTAQKLKLNDEAREWFEKALAINPNYEPASEVLSKMK